MRVSYRLSNSHSGLHDYGTAQVPGHQQRRSVNRRAATVEDGGGVNSGKSWPFQVQDEGHLQALAELLAPQVTVGDVILLWGDVGAGKTTFTR